MATRRTRRGVTSSGKAVKPYLKVGGGTNFLFEGPSPAPERPEDIEAMKRVGLLLPKRPSVTETPQQKAARLAVGIARDAKKVGWGEPRLLQQLRRTHIINQDIPQPMWRQATEEAIREFRKKEEKTK